jgi:hypothetical protein
MGLAVPANWGGQDRVFNALFSHGAQRCLSVSEGAPTVPPDSINLASSTLRPISYTPCYFAPGGTFSTEKY